MTSPLGHHTIGHTIIIFCTNDRLWLGVGPVFRQTLNCTNRISSYHKEVFFREQQCISSMWFSKFQSTALPGMLWLHKHRPKSPSIKWLCLKDCCDPPSPFFVVASGSQPLESVRAKHVSGICAVGWQADLGNVWSSMNLNLSIFSCR